MRPSNLLCGAVALATLPLSLHAQGLAALGPLNPDNGYPEWYEDANGLRLGQCLNNSGFCILPGPVNLTSPNLPFPDNYGGTFPDEFFWSYADATIDGPGGESALLVIGLEGAFANGPVAAGDQVSFARVRIRVTGLEAGTTYTVTTPVGNFVFVADGGARSINFTDDVGILVGDFTGALGGAIGPFLMWDSGLPLFDADGNEYLGDPNVLHTITGSPFGTNEFRVQGGGLNMSTDLFTLQGMVVSAVAPPVAPVADFSAAPLSGTEPLNVSFTDLSSGDVTAWSWSFGDGTGSTAQNPTHAYAAGTYTVALTVSGPAGSDTVTRRNLIAVAAQPPTPTGALILANPVPGIAGVANTMVLTGCSPGQSVSLYSSTNQGASLVSAGACGKIALGLAKPAKRVATATANANGVATFSFTPSRRSAGTVFFFQALEPATCRVSGVVGDQL